MSSGANARTCDRCGTSIDRDPPHYYRCSDCFRQHGPKATEARVNLLRVIDGDTVIVASRNGNGQRVRLYGIDARETGERFSLRAAEELKNLLGKEEVIMEEMEPPDNYDRRVVLLHRGERRRSVNLRMVELGWADAYRNLRNNELELEFVKASEEARARRIGMWQEAAPSTATEPAELEPTNRRNTLWIFSQTGAVVVSVCLFFAGLLIAGSIVGPDGGLSMALVVSAVAGI